jgi:hypothetical protein
LHCFSDQDRQRALNAAFQDAIRPSVECRTCSLTATPYAAIDRTSGLTHERFLADYLHQGKPVVVTDVDTSWDIRNMNFDDLAQKMPAAPLLPRAAVQSGGVRGLRLMESYMATTLAALAADRRVGKPDPYYYSWLNVHFNSSFLAQGLYSVPYFLNQSEPFIAEWMYIGSTGSGVMPHVDHMCMGTWFLLQIHSRFCFFFSSENGY